MPKCGACDGSGRVMQVNSSGLPEHSGICPACGGSGWFGPNEDPLDELLSGNRQGNHSDVGMSGHPEPRRRRKDLSAEQYLSLFTALMVLMFSIKTGMEQTDLTSGWLLAGGGVLAVATYWLMMGPLRKLTEALMLILGAAILAGIAYLIYQLFSGG